MNDLIERYIYAAVRDLSPKLREDVSQELRGLIDDMLSERCGNRPPEEKDVRVVLTELGSPRELGEKYDGSTQKCLIGQPYYKPYKLVLQIVLACAAAGLTISAAILQLIQPQAWPAAIGQWLLTLWQGLIGSFGFVTLLFALFQRFGVKLEQPFNFDELPPAPKKRQTIPIWQGVAGIVFSGVFLVVFLGIPQVFGAPLSPDGGWIPLFNTEFLRQRWYIPVLFALLDICREAMKLTERQYTRRLLAVTVGADLISAGLAVWWLTGWPLINPEFSQALAAKAGAEGNVISGLFSGFNGFFLAVMLFALAMDILDTFFRSRS